MEWIGPFLVGILIVLGILQFFWTYALSAIAQKTDQSEFMQVLAWIPILQLAPTIVAGGGSVSRFLAGFTTLIVGNISLIAAGAFQGGGLGQVLAALGLTLSTLLSFAYFGWISWNTAVARDLPGWVGLLLFVPIINFFVYPYLAFHDGFAAPHKIGLAIGLVFIVGGNLSSFETARKLSGGESLSPVFVKLISEIANIRNSHAESAEPNVIDGRTSEIDYAALDTSPSLPPSLPPPESNISLNTREYSTDDSIRALYRLKGCFDELDSLTTPKNLKTDDNRTQALQTIQEIRGDLEIDRQSIGEQAYQDLNAHMIEAEALIHDPTIAISEKRTTRRSQHPVHFGPAALAQIDQAETARGRNDPAAPIHPFPIEPDEDCPTNTEIRTRKDGKGGEEEWCQQLRADGGLRHGWYVRYLENGRPETMGQYESGLRMGVWTRFHSTGEVRAQAEFHEGMQDGWLLSFDRSGQRIRSARYQRGTLIPSE